MWNTEQLIAKKICQCSKIASKKEPFFFFWRATRSPILLEVTNNINKEIKFRALADENNQ